MQDNRTDLPKCTKNQLKDIIDWLKIGDVVVLHHNNYNGHIYHNCMNLDPNIRYIFINVHRMPNLLNEGEWPWYIEQSYNKCICHKRNHILNNLIDIENNKVYRFLA